MRLAFRYLKSRLCVIVLSFVTEEYRGQRISGVLIACANRYLGQTGLDRSYTPTEYTGLYEHYGCRYVRDRSNYGVGIDRLYMKDI